jgi:hypothetical protein
VNGTVVDRYACHLRKLNKASGEQDTIQKENPSPANERKGGIVVRV